MPTPTVDDCGAIDDGRNRASNIANNVLALLVVLTLALVAVAVMEIVNQLRKREAPPD